jgi:hypothetical protein
LPGNRNSRDGGSRESPSLILPGVFAGGGRPAGLDIGRQAFEPDLAPARPSCHRWIGKPTMLRHSALEPSQTRT